MNQASVQQHVLLQPFDRKRVAIVQSNYIPWRGYFAIVDAVDEFILLDSVQYTRRDWRNRNKLKTQGGTMWLSIPVENKGRYSQRIRDTRIADPDWNSKHWEVIQRVYKKAPFFAELSGVLEDLYRRATFSFLSQINRHFLCGICDLLGIETAISEDRDYSTSNDRTTRLVDLCVQASATDYVSGPAAREYLETEQFYDKKITVSWMDYSGLAAYGQLYPPFDGAVSILDAICHLGIDKVRVFGSNVGAQHGS
jgi:hypothetical protein